MTSPGTREPVSLAVARALDERLHITLDDHFDLCESRLYGCCVIDSVDDLAPDTFRYSFLGSAPSVYDLLEGSYAVLARAFDAACVVTAGWGAPVDSTYDDDEDCDGDCDAPASRPSEHPDRFRLVICTAVCDEGLCTVVRDSRRPEEPVAMTERGEGMLPDALELMWFGEILA
jgi:hypothetical protein